MEAEAPALTRMTEEEFFAFVETQEGKYEFHNGEVLAMSGGTGRHTILASRLQGMLFMSLHGNPCQPYTSEMHLAVEATDSFVHPDNTIVCGPLEYKAGPGADRAVLNARVVLEVLSDSTEAYDRGGKFNLYQQMPLLEEYVLISQHQPEVQSFLRQPDGTWNVAFFRGLNATATIRCLPLDLAMSELYAGW